MTEEKQVKTKGSKKSLKTAANAWKFIGKDYMEGHQHKSEGKPVVWSCSMVEKELFYAMGFFPFYPEHFPSMCAVMPNAETGEKEAIRFARIAEQAGYSSALCGYQRVGTGYVMNNNLEDGPLGGMAMPDLLVTSSTACDTRMKWFENMSQRLNVPLFTLDRPERVGDGQVFYPKAHELRYYRSQLEDLIKLMEEISGTKYDSDKMNECMDWSYKTNDIRLEILEYRKAVPSPMGSADSFATMYPGMYCSGTEKAYNFYKDLRDEVKERVASGLGQVENERFRLMWFGIPTWFNMGIFNYFEPLGGVFAYEPIFNPIPTPPRNNDDPLTEMAVGTLSTGSSVIEGVKNSVPEVCREYNITGAVIAYLITCRPVYLPSLVLRRLLEEELDIPSVLIECDLVDERTFSEAQVMTRMDAFAEQLLKKIEKGN
ncbi:MAG: 2-hydroxyacyl-CoA dehydratase [Desulfobacteraceae bacterium]|nr:2-hydroxyacyl-CoA dehydratase [Desulfobacteraceae bacterium]